MSSVAVIDLGSNSIKLLVAGRKTDGSLEALLTETIDARISTGISHAGPRLGAEGMDRGLAAIKELLAAAAPLAPVQTVLVATSAVRDAANGPAFRDRVRAETGQTIRILTGEEEANLIGRGLTCDPALSGLHNFYVFDLGGGSLECLAFRDRRIAQAVSLPLGCVRLAEIFVADPAGPFPPETTARIAAHARDLLAGGGFRFDLSPAQAVFAGGSMTTARAIFAARRGEAMESTSARITVRELQALLTDVGVLNLKQRQQVPGLPPPRADVFPTALATIIAIAEAGGLKEFHHSLYNLRWGLADEALASH